MPFNFRIGKRSQQYNVASKDLFIIPIELLTNECIECTFLSTSTGQECLNNVCQKIGIQQPEYFNLLFRSKKNVDQWIDLNKPLKKQLTKYSTETRLYFRLQYFVPNFHFLSDDVSRYHYFCAMKNLVIDGRIACSRDDAILLASFTLQAEFGDYSPERHTVEYLNNFSLFPKSMVTSKIARDVLIECAINAYRNLEGVPPSVAEIYYISEAQRREGYGQEGFPASDLTTGQDVCLGVCIRGIFVVNTNNNTLELFKWMDIANLMHNKKVFTIERYTNKYSKSYSTYDSEYASCIWQTCVEQHQYFMKGIQTATENESIGNADSQQSNINHSMANIPFIHNTELFNTNDASNIINKLSNSLSTDNNDLNQPIQSVYETIGTNINVTNNNNSNNIDNNGSNISNNNNNNNNVNNTNINQQAPQSTSAQQTQIGSQELVDTIKPEYNLNGTAGKGLLRKRSSIEPVDLHQIKINCVNNYNLKSGELSNETNLNMNVPSDLTLNNSAASIPIYENQSNLNDLTYEQRKKLLPPYKNPPDYETFLKQKYLANPISQSLSSIPARLASHNQMNSSSSSLIHPSMHNHHHHHHHHLHHHNNICTVSSSTMSVPQLLQHQQKQPVFVNNVYRNFTDLSNLINDKNLSNNNNNNNTSTSNQATDISHRCSLPPTDSLRNGSYESFGLNQLNIQHQRLQKSGMFTSSSPDLNSLNLAWNKRNQQHIKTNVAAKINELNNNNIIANNPIKKPHYFTSVPDLSFKNQHSNPMNYDLGIEKKNKSKSFFPFGGKNLKFFWPQNKTGSEPNLFKNFSYSPNCYHLKRSKFSAEKLDFSHSGNNVNYSNELQLIRSTKNYSISQKIDELPEMSAEQPQIQQQQQQQPQSTNNCDNFINNNQNNNTNTNCLQSVANNIGPILIKTNQTQLKHKTSNATKKSTQYWSNIVDDKTVNDNNNHLLVNSGTVMTNKQEQITKADSGSANFNQIKFNSRIIVFDKSFDDQDFTKEFELLPRMNPTAKFTTASLHENILKNRFRDILPYEENRVKLTASKDNKHGYINASHVIMTFGMMKQHYIAAQGPLPNTTLDFWQMVFEQNINLIVMVTNFSEAGSQKCYTYLPLSNEPNKNTVRFGDYEITCNYTSATLTYISSYLTLSHNGQKRSITHLRYTDWNDHSIPGDLQGFLTFLSEMDNMYRQNNREGSGFGKKRSPKILPPILVHCSAGAGRSGVVILCDALLKCLDHNFEPIDIPKALIELRFQRMISVQHCEQFRFVCQVLSQHLSNSRLI